MKKIILLLAVICLSCNIKQEFKTITINKEYSLSIPENLEKAANLNVDASLQYQDLINEFYVITIDEDRESFNNAVIQSGSAITPDIEGYYKVLTLTLTSKIPNSKLYDQKTTMINGKRAKMFSLSGNVQGLDIFYRYALIEGQSKYHQIMLWTQKSKENQHKELMEKIILSFKEIGGKNASKSA